MALHIDVPGPLQACKVEIRYFDAVLSASRRRRPTLLRKAKTICFDAVLVAWRWHIVPQLVPPLPVLLHPQKSKLNISTPFCQPRNATTRTMFHSHHLLYPLNSRNLIFRHRFVGLAMPLQSCSTLAPRKVETICFDAISSAPFCRDDSIPDTHSLSPSLHFSSVKRGHFSDVRYSDGSHSTHSLSRRFTIVKAL